MEQLTFLRHTTKLSIAGLALDLPAFFIVSVGMLQMMLGMPDLSETIFTSIGLTPQSFILHPIIVLGGMFLAITMNAIPTFRIRLEPQNGSLVTIIRTELKFFNLAVLGLSLFLLCSILLYAFGENFEIVAR
ncbi:MAG: hypothetical protein HY707_02955 [Ignavibacteriae bacterium]|nr:hypothetical protein [Ignavibacteriota bacterium]